MVFPKIKVKRLFICFVLLSSFILLWYLLPRPTISFEEESISDLEYYGETVIAPEDTGIDMDKILIEFLDFKLNYHIKHELINCDNKSLLILIPSLPENFHQRMEIRESWIANIVS